MCRCPHNVVVAALSHVLWTVSAQCFCQFQSHEFRSINYQRFNAHITTAFGWASRVVVPTCKHFSHLFVIDYNMDDWRQVKQQKPLKKLVQKEHMWAQTIYARRWELETWANLNVNEPRSLANFTASLLVIDPAKRPSARTAATSRLAKLLKS